MASKYQINSESHNKNAFHQNQVVVVVIPFPAQGHLNPLLHLSRLFLSHNIPVHYVGTPTHNRQATVRVQGWDPKSISNIRFHDFEVPPFVSPPPNPNEETKFPTHMIPCFEASSHLREPVAELLQSLSSIARRVIVIHDSLTASVAQDAKNITNAENYTFHSGSAFFTFLFFWEAMGKPPLENSHVPEVPSLDEFIPSQMIDFISSQVDFHNFSDGNIYNTTRAFESPYMESLERIMGNKQHWALGPFNPLSIEKKNSKGKHLSIEWLDKQEPKSVIYVSFGTTTTLTEEQVEQIAIGLKQSNQKFIWVLRDADKGDIFNGDEVRRHELPNGFEEGVEEMGLVVRDWAPQLEILSHSSTGGFMSNCGWNSCIESITMGVPIATWPMHADQPRNSVLITQVLKIGLVVSDWAKRYELVTASVIENAVRRLMETKEGDDMRERARDLKKAIHRSMDEGGVSRMEMDSFIAHITR
ncbi:zeatin O-glucosyltransferase-like [Gastrolobium bilobum]|uniref:zeatin O-glucosyltransferase-like n=1 Tax=Gastrolobium bilobum TaxID=150636 RepID=UPI002AB0A888|nr:zeatin O-glucosyltransferase-like [Gastrolobium bilobum]